MMTCPASVRTVVLEILTTGLLRIRAGRESPDRVLSEADHLHNLPDLLENFELVKLLDYWEVERPEFSRYLLDDERSTFQPLWTELERCITSTRELAVPAR